MNTNTAVLEVLGVFKGSSKDLITKDPQGTIYINNGGVRGDARHYGDLRGSRGTSRKWLAVIPSEIEQIRLNWNQVLEENGIVIPAIEKIDPAWLGPTMLLSNLEGFSTNFPNNLRFQSGLCLYTSISNVPCIAAGGNILRNLFGDTLDDETIKKAAMLFPTAAKGLHGVVGGVFIDHYGTVSVGDKVFCYW